MTPGTKAKMADGATAYVSPSCRYFIRYEPEFAGFTSIAYYDLKTRERIPLAKGSCSECGETMESRMCGDFQGCGCGKSFVDTDRWFPERHRYGGALVELEKKPEALPERQRGV